jgi:hypothetical protein
MRSDADRNGNCGETAMIVFTGDWVKVSDRWRQVVDVDPEDDSFAVLDTDGQMQWWGTGPFDVYGGHESDLSMQAKLKEYGL